VHPHGTWLLLTCILDAPGGPKLSRV